MQNYVGIKKNSGYILYVGLTSQADTKLLQVNPTIASGDFKVSIDGGAFANLNTLPAVTPAGGRAVKITLSAGEMNGDNIMVMCVDAAGTEWCDLPINIQTTPVDASVVQIDGTANASATFNLKKINVVNSSGDAAVFSSTGSDGNGISASGNGASHGIKATGGTTGSGIVGLGGATSGTGIIAQGQNGNSNGLGCQGNGTGSGISSTGGATGNGLSLAGVGTGHGIVATGGTSNGHGALFTGSGTGSGFNSTGGITGNGIAAAGGATSGNGIYAYAVGGGSGIAAVATATSPGILAQGSNTGDGFRAIGGATGNGVAGYGGAASGAGLLATAQGSGTGITATGVGSVAILATQGISGPFDAATYNAMADVALVRNWLTTDTSTAPTNCTINALRANRNWAVSGSTYTTYKEDGTTPAWTATLTTDAAGLPVVAFDSN